MVELNKSWCPFCGGEDCVHFKGWTDNRRDLLPMEKLALPRPLRDGDAIVDTSVSLRVYRNRRIDVFTKAFVDVFSN